MTGRTKIADENGSNVVELGFFAHHPDPYPLYQLMREREPLKYSPIADSWRLTRHADIVAVLRDPRFGFPSVIETLPAWHDLITGAGRPPESQPVKWVKLQKKVFELRQLWILVQNPPAHTRLRGLVQPHYTIAAVRNVVPFLQATADSLIDAALARGEMDLLHDFANPLVLAMTMRIMGMPFADSASFNRWSHELGRYLEEEITGLNYQRESIAAISLIEYFRKLMQARQAPYGDDVIGALMRDFEAGKLSEDELLAMCMLLSLGGHGTTRSMIGNGMLALLRHPDQWRLLQNQPELLSSAVEECLRYDATGQHAGRLAHSDISLDGVKIEKGEWVNLMLGAANWDPEVFPEPARFDITRGRTPHLGFGQGIHYCLGAHLARSVMQIAFGTLARRLPTLALRDDTIEWSPDLHLRAPKALPVVWDR